MGKASRLKQERRRQGNATQEAGGGGRPQAGMAAPPQAASQAEPPARPVLVTVTNEPFQPVRLYWSVAERAAAQARLTQLKCIVPEPEEQDCWQWLFDDESKRLPIGKGYKAVPKHRRPLILGRFRFPDAATLTLDTGSTERALAAAQFFMSRLGPAGQLSRCRIVNRLFAAEEGLAAGVQALLASLDQNVTMVDPAKSEARMNEEIRLLHAAGVPDAMSVMMQKDLDSGEDVPPVEDFPMDPDDDAQLTHLKFMLLTRTSLAMEHWLGHTDMTLTRLLVRTVAGGREIPGLKLP